MATEVSQTTDSESGTPPEVFKYTPWRYLRAMFLIAWCAFAHPFSTTVIDLATGEMRHSGDGEDVPSHG